MSQPTCHEQSLAHFCRLETRAGSFDITIRELVDHEPVYAAQLTYHIPYDVEYYSCRSAGYVNMILHLCTCSYFMKYLYPFHAMRFGHLHAIWSFMPSWMFRKQVSTYESSPVRPHSLFTSRRVGDHVLEYMYFSTDVATALRKP